MVLQKNNIEAVKKVYYTLLRFQSFKEQKRLDSLNLKLYLCDRQELMALENKEFLDLKRFLVDITFNKILFSKYNFALGIFRDDLVEDTFDIPLKNFSLIFRQNEEDKELMEVLTTIGQKYGMFRLPLDYSWFFQYCLFEQQWYCYETEDSFDIFDNKKVIKTDPEKYLATKYEMITSQELINRLKSFLDSKSR